MVFAVQVFGESQSHLVIYVVVLISEGEELPLVNQHLLQHISVASLWRTPASESNVLTSQGQLGNVVTLSLLLRLSNPSPVLLNHLSTGSILPNHEGIAKGAGPSNIHNIPTHQHERRHLILTNHCTLH